MILDLPTMGADYMHKDIFVQVNHMIEADGFNRNLTQNALQRLIEAFKAAQLENPDKTNGINLHIDCGKDCTMNPVTGETWGNNRSGKNLSMAQPIRLGTPDADIALATLHDETVFSASSELQGLSSKNFPQARAAVFHYAIIGVEMDKHACGQTVYPTGKGYQPGSQFIVAIRVRPGSKIVSTGEVITSDEYDWMLAGTFMHELGHNLGLAHGGPIQVGPLDDSIETTNKPNHFSVMNYSWQTGLLKDNTLSGSHEPERLIDYSHFANPTLNEDDLDENNGIRGVAKVNAFRVRYWCETSGDRKEVLAANAPVDWNCSAIPFLSDGIDAGHVRTNINNDYELDEYGCPTTAPRRSKLTSHEEWHRLVFTGGQIGKLASGAAFPPGQFPSSEMTVDEMEKWYSFSRRNAYDLNEDGQVDLDDLAILQGLLNKPLSAVTVKADINGDGKIDALDARILVTHCTKPRCAK